MELRAAYVRVEMKKLENETRREIARISLTPGENSAEYILQYKNIIAIYQRKAAALQELNPNPNDYKTRTLHQEPGSNQDTRDL